MVLYLEQFTFHFLTIHPYTNIQPSFNLLSGFRTLFSSEAEGQHQECQAVECNPVSDTLKMFALLIAVQQTSFNTKFLKYKKKKKICLYKKMNWFFFLDKISYVLEMSLFPEPFLHCALCTFQLLCVKLHSCSYCSWKPNNASITKKYKGENLLIGLCFCRFSRSQVTQS